MIPGIVSRLSEEVVASASSITVNSDLARVTGTTSIATINQPNQGGFSGMLILVPVDGSVSTLTTGNIPVAVTMAQNRATLFAYDNATQKWYPGAIS